MKKLLLLSVSLPSLVMADLAIAQQQAAQDEDTVTVIGSRVKGRTALDSNVPVDVIQSGELANTPSLNMKDAISAVSPSYVVNRNPIGDGNSLVRTSSLRGLNNGEILTLLNGKRMHRNATIHTAGWQSADVGSLSVNALKSISILRDGAAAQYGADAVAGVIDLTLDDSEGISGEALFSQYYAGDGFAYNLASKAGISLADRGFLTVTAQYGHTDATNRADVHLYAVDQITKWNQQQAGTLGTYTDSDGDLADARDFDGQFTDPAELDPATIAPFGVNEESHFTVTWNSAMEIGENSEVYTFGNFGRKHHKEPFNYRAGMPHGYTPPFGSGNSGGSRRNSYSYNDYAYLYGPAAADQNEYLLRQIRRTTTNSTVDGGAGEVADADGFITDGGGNRLLMTNPNGGFAGLGTHPNGYNPWFEIDAQDIGAYAGFRGSFDNGLEYDISGSIGTSRVDNTISDTHNPSLGGAQLPDNADGTPGGIDYANVQTAFYIGSQVNTERTISADFNYTVDTDAVDNINVAFGAQYRTEQYKNVVGEQNSWLAGPLAGPNLKCTAFDCDDDGNTLDINGDRTTGGNASGLDPNPTAVGAANGLTGGRGLNVGSDGFGGFSPATFFDASRSNWAVYVDVDTDVSEDFNVAVAGRYEDFTDFGDTFSWKVAARYQLLEDLLAIRGAASTGFHAPTVAQINNTQVRTGFRGDGSQTQTGTFTADSIPGQVFGIAQVGPELARNLSAGFIFTPGDNTNITIDVFQVKLRDSLAQTPDFDVEDYPVEFAAIAAAGFQGAATLTGVDFPSNEGARRVRGIEIVATQGFELESSSINLTLAFAHTSVRLTETKLEPRNIHVAENATAPYRATFTANWNMDNFNVMGRARWVSTRDRLSGLGKDNTFIGTLDDDGNPYPLSAYRIDQQNGRVFFDLALTYDVNEQFAVTVGANNILNTFPKEQRLVVDSTLRAGRRYIDDGLDWQGGQYYARLSANF